MSKLVRLARESDQSEVVQLAELCGQEEVEQKGFAEMWQWMCFGSEGCFGLVAERGGSIVASISIRESKYQYRGESLKVAISGQLMVAPDHRNSLLYPQIIKETYRHLSFRKFDCLITYTMKTNVSRANQRLGLRRDQVLGVSLVMPLSYAVAPLFSFRQFKFPKKICADEFLAGAERIEARLKIRKDYLGRYVNAPDERGYCFYKIGDALAVCRVVRLKYGVPFLVLCDLIANEKEDDLGSMIAPLAFIAIKNLCPAFITLKRWDSIFSVKISSYDLLIKNISSNREVEYFLQDNVFSFFENDFI